ncbi:MAG TPA: DivIVA domain-containing protein [Acidimicrobiales bacterium]|nr:DivIVA domain-containing protein [Acidimicrobiales bacterium]
MDVTPQLLHDVEFREAKRGGYNTQDVDEFLERLAVGLERQDAAVKEARQRLEAAEARVAEAERRAAHAEQSATETSASDETLKRTLVLAQRTADAAIREAEERSARLIASAEDEAARMLAEAHDSTARVYAEAEEEALRAHHEARSRVLAELQELEGSRELLRADVELLEHHIEAQRERLRAAIRDLHTIVEDPSSLGEVAIPALSEVVVPEPGPEPEPQPRQRGGRRLVARPATEVEWEGDEDHAWTEAAPEPDAYEPVQLETPPSRTGPRSARDEARVDPRPLLADAREIAPAEDDEEEGDDAYLAELRKAMTDDRPLGPREDHEGGSYEEAPTTSRSRFGRRR